MNVGELKSLLMENMPDKAKPHGILTLEELLAEVNNNEELLLERSLKFYQYKAMCKVHYNTTDKDLHLGAEKICECLRAVPGVTRVSTASNNKIEGYGIYSVRLISQKNAKEAFISFKKNCLEKFKNIILKVEIGAGTLETKNFVK